MPQSKRQNSVSSREREEKRLKTSATGSQSLSPQAQETDQPEVYMSGMSKGDRVHQILKDMREKHRWG